MGKATDPFSKLKMLSTEASLLSSISGLLEWDQETHMPHDAIHMRSAELELMAGLIHKQRTSSSFKKALSELVDLSTGKMKEPGASLEMKASAREWLKEFLKDSKLPSSFVKNFSKTTSAALAAWDEAKKTANFKLFLPHLEKIVALSRKKAKFLGYKKHPYDALLDLYEPDLTTDSLTTLFEKLKPPLINILKETQKKQKTIDLHLGTFTEDLQIKTGLLLLKAMGFSKETSRLDTSSHPFCTGLHPKDIRMTTRIDLKDPASSIFSIIHEGGHGLYHQNLPVEHFGTPLCEAASYGVDESQSRLWETIIGRGLPFWKFFYPKLQELFPENLSDISLEDFFSWVNRIEPSTIRVEADEVTYCLHIILRFEIEKGLIEGSIKVKDVPTVWNKKMKEYLGITPSNDKEGCLQDIHWAMGGIGYFPTYAIGNILAAQLFESIKISNPDFKHKIENGDFTFLREWLYENIHKHGKIYTPKELILKATRKSLGVDSYINYLEAKFLKK